jgi:SET domain-containing protein
VTSHPQDLTPEPECWLHPDLEVRPSPIAHLGLFARAAIPAGTVVSRLGGRLVSGAQLDTLFADTPQRPDQPYIDTISVGEDLHLVLPRSQLNHFGNHSCDPNLWWVDVYTLAARRPITASEEVTNDYGTSTALAEFTMKCTCGSPLCRKTVTGRDWRRIDLQQRYGNHWIPLLLDRIGRGRQG